MAGLDPAVHDLIRQCDPSHTGESRFQSDELHACSLDSGSRRNDDFAVSYPRASKLHYLDTTSST
jgi:hypothetical protein